MYSCEHDPTAAARTTFADTGYHHHWACAAPRSLQPAAAHRPAQQVVLPAAAAAAVAAVQPRRAKSKKHGAAPSRPSSSRRSSTTVVATDVNNFRAMVQELTGFPPAAIFRPLPRRVHAASPFVGVAGGVGQGCSGSERHGHGGSAGNNNSTAAAAGVTSPKAPAVALPVMPPQCAPLGVFDGLADLGSPEFDSWGDLSIE